MDLQYICRITGIGRTENQYNRIPLGIVKWNPKPEPTTCNWKRTRNGGSTVYKSQYMKPVFENQYLRRGRDMQDEILGFEVGAATCSWTRRQSNDMSLH